MYFQCTEFPSSSVLLPWIWPADKTATRLMYLDLSRSDSVQVAIPNPRDNGDLLSGRYWSCFDLNVQVQKITVNIDTHQADLKPKCVNHFFPFTMNQSSTGQHWITTPSLGGLINTESVTVNTRRRTNQSMSHESLSSTLHLFSAKPFN
jgi:hypothetical protein